MGNHGPRTQVLRGLAEDDRPLTTRRHIMRTRTERNRRRVRHTVRYITVCALAAAVGCATPIANRADTAGAPLVIQEQGSFAVGGTVVTTPGTFDPITQDSSQCRTPVRTTSR